ncbi:MAG: SH3 domain-containing protein [Oscillospiraceae bacterium]|nr:SH3 domain-containing protein [Oscillospiraceae bacterium]
MTSTTETSSDSGNTVSEATSTTSAGNNEPSVIISTITDNSNPQEQWTERTFEAPITFYVNQNNVNSRSKPIQGSSVVKTYSLNEKVTTVSETDTYYFKLEDGSYVHSDYLSKNPVEIKDTKLKIGDKNSKGYTIIGFTSDGTPYIGIDDNYEKKGTVIVDYISGRPIYTDDPEKQQEIFDKIPDGDLSHIIMGN